MLASGKKITDSRGERRKITMAMKLVQNSRGVAPRFAITVGLQEGYGPSAKIHSADEVISLVEAHLKECASTGRPYLTGSVTAGTVVYAWLEGEGSAGGGHEPAACYSGEVNPRYNAGMTPKAVEEFLNGLAECLGVALGRPMVYVAFKGEIWILQREESATPRLV